MKKGSALLIVLGMLAFMVISAVAFSAFMRYSRLPSSYLRRTSSSRQLVKAALAEAIDIVDAAVADNPHPGVGSSAISYPRDGTGDSRNRNYWRNHVFVGTNQLIAAEDTVSTLTLEGLAYLPPALINEARFYSRHSTAGKWHTFGYDCGRFAFCAVDVSDHLNVNKTPADIGRGSSPENRFSLAYVFENDKHTAYTLQPSKWDAFMEKYVSFADAKDSLKMPEQKGAASSAAAGQNKLPFVSLADLNLAVNKNGDNFSQYFPFLKGLKNNGLSDAVATDTIAEMQRCMAFVADGYYPTSGGAGDDDDYDLSDDKYQPFRQSDLKKDNKRAVGNFFDNNLLSRPAAKRLKDSISCLGLATLWDYLDEDDVPVSLAIPSVERIPMICGMKVEMGDMSVNVGMKLLDNNGKDLASLSEIEKTDYPGADVQTPPGALGLTRNARYKKQYTLNSQEFTKGIQAGKIKVILAYPFLRDELRDGSDFALEGHVKFFLTGSAFRFRTDTNNDQLHFRSSDEFTKSDYSGNGVFHLLFNQGYKQPDNVEKQEDALDDSYVFAFGPKFSAIKNDIDKNPLLTVTYVQEQESYEPDPTDHPGEYAWRNKSTNPTRDEAECGMPPLNSLDCEDPDFKDKKTLAGYLNGNATKEVQLRMAVWLRIVKKNGVTVDLVPACISDDDTINSGFNNSHSPLLNTCGAPYPLISFDCSPRFKFKDTEFDSFSAKAGQSFSKVIICGDPRWNWAPEHWFEATGLSDITKEEWLQRCGRGGNGRDPDIMMATSDAGYMQSVYELAFLPRLMKNGFGGGGDSVGDLAVPEKKSSDWAKSFEACSNSDLMWRTYRPFAYADGDDDNVRRDSFEDVGFVSDGNGPKVNPYAGSVVANLGGGVATGVDATPLLAAFANPPESWWSASANTDTGVSKKERSAESFNKKYAFSNMNSDAMLDWYDLVTKKGVTQQMDDLPVVENFCYSLWERVRNNGGNLWNAENWIDVYNDLWKEGEKESDRDKRLMGVKLENNKSTFYGVDRKFLYGYWRESLDVKQQLFLIFVRAEPMMMGGGAIGQTPPQLGARAVALVWRNPYPGSKPYWPQNAQSLHEKYTPHQTRVLFYRQFD